jgi:hypothetical protein
MQNAVDNTNLIRSWMLFFYKHDMVKSLSFTIIKKGLTPYRQKNHCGLKSYGSTSATFCQVQ